MCHQMTWPQDTCTCIPTVTAIYYHVSVYADRTELTLMKTCTDFHNKSVFDLQWVMFAYDMETDCMEIDQHIAGHNHADQDTLNPTCSRCRSVKFSLTFSRYLNWHMV